MAVDSRNKRASAIAGGVLAFLALPAPDGDVNIADRRHVSTLYRFAEPTPFSQQGLPVLLEQNRVVLDESYQCATLERYQPVLVEL